MGRSEGTGPGDHKSLSGALVGTARLVIVVGKGGVGKTTVSAALARVAADEGRRVALVEVEGRHGSIALFGGEGLDYDERVLERRPSGGEVVGRVVRPDAALAEYLDDHGLRRFSKRLRDSGALEVVAGGMPGIRDLLVLGKVKQMVATGGFDLVLVDAPASGHAVTFLQSAVGLLDAVRSGPVRAQAEDVRALLRDPERCRALPVTLAEETPINETIETAFALEDRVGLSLGPVIVNRVAPAVARLTAADLRARAAGAGWKVTAAGAQVLSQVSIHAAAQRAAQQSQIEHLAHALPLAQVHLPLVEPFTLDAVADALRAALGETAARV